MAGSMGNEAGIFVWVSEIVVPLGSEEVEGVIAGDTDTSRQRFSARDDFALQEDIWQCLDSVLVVGCPNGVGGQGVHDGYLLGEMQGCC